MKIILFIKFGITNYMIKLKLFDIKATINKISCNVGQILEITYDYRVWVLVYTVIEYYSRVLCNCIQYYLEFVLILCIL